MCKPIKKELDVDQTGYFIASYGGIDSYNILRQYAYASPFECQLFHLAYGKINFCLHSQNFICVIHAAFTLDAPKTMHFFKKFFLHYLFDDLVLM